MFILEIKNERNLFVENENKESFFFLSAIKMPSLRFV
jgi:hypothetical protein